MTDYKKLVDDLRDIGKTMFALGTTHISMDNVSISFAYDKGWGQTANDAAAAIEALQADIKRLKEVINELREAQTYIDHYGDRWMTSAKDVPTSAYEHGYADGRDEAEAQLPKLGEWQKAKPKGVVTYSDGYAECSHCHETIWLGWWMNFCPHCGTQNKIIDPDDYDWAKMEVQE